MELKIVLTVKDGRGMIGVFAPECDPQFMMTQGDLRVMLADAQRFVVVAEDKWKTARRNPAFEVPRPAPVAAAAGTPSARPVPAAAAAPKTAQKAMF